MKIIRQGDVGLRPVDVIPDGTVLGHCTLAKGEVTGHTHRVTEGEAEIVDVNGTWYLRVKSPSVVIGHEEHAPVTVKQGSYQILRQREYDDFEEWKRVQD